MALRVGSTARGSSTTTGWGGITLRGVEVEVATSEGGDGGGEVVALSLGGAV